MAMNLAIVDIYIQPSSAPSTTQAISFYNAPELIPEPPLTLVIEQGQSWNYTFGAAYDEDGDEVKIEYDLGRAIGFVQLDEQTKTIRIKNGTSINGSFKISINITDTSEQQLWTSYDVVLLVMELHQIN